jgi:hypothetical protein
MVDVYLVVVTYRGLHKLFLSKGRANSVESVPILSIYIIENGLTGFSSHQPHSGLVVSRHVEPRLNAPAWIS